MTESNYARTWHHLQRAFEAVAAKGHEPIILSALPFRTDTHHDHSRLPFVLVPPGRLIATAIGMRAALHDAMLVLIGAAETVTLGTNHLIHAARRNMGMTLLVLRSDLLAGGDDELDRSGWIETGHPTGVPAGTPLDWASALQAGLVARAEMSKPDELADLLIDAHRRRGFSVIGLTDDTSLPMGIQSTNEWPEFFGAYREWAAPLLRDDHALSPVPTVTPDPDAPDRVEVRIVGIGGQGVKLAGTILSEAAGLGAGLWATHYGEYGSATRGGLSKVDVVYGRQRITYAGSDHPDVLIALSTAGVENNRSAVGPNTHVVVDEDVDGEAGAEALEVPIIRLARAHTGKPIAAGVTSLGCVAALADGIDLETIEEVVNRKLPGRIAGKNVSAMVEAYETTMDRIGALI